MISKGFMEPKPSDTVLGLKRPKREWLQFKFESQCVIIDRLDSLLTQRYSKPGEANKQMLQE
jgi:hypothetical protein